MEKVINLAHYEAQLRRRFFAAKGVQQYKDIATPMGVRAENIKRFAHGGRLNWENMAKLEAWVFEEERRQGVSEEGGQ